jgi:hypothetical protein
MEWFLGLVLGYVCLLLLTGLLLCVHGLPAWLRAGEPKGGIALGTRE